MQCAAETTKRRRCTRDGVYEAAGEHMLCTLHHYRVERGGVVKVADDVWRQIQEDARRMGRLSEYDI